ncbi:hypothetical protein HDU98_006814 [Podochytrium sp. JEL0797]|nr:hypothetical protein HDU98_006814 [Podochytrium sp. JEL0797]
MDATLIALFQDVQTLLNEISARQSAFKVQQSESTAHLEALIDRIESSLNESQRNLLLQTTTALSATKSHLSRMESSTELSLASISNQLHLLQNPQRKFYTCLTDVPREVLIQILSWITPTQVFKLRQVSGTFNAILTTKHFAAMNLRRFPPSKDCYLTPANGEKEDPDCHDASVCEQVFFRGPTAFQTVFAETRLKPITVMNWYLGESELPFTISNALGLCVNLIHMDLSECRLEGTIPVQVALLGSLRFLNLSCNELSGEIPVELGGLAALETLNLSDNYLSGEIPVELGGLARLKELNLCANELTGGLPSEVGSLEQLEALLLDDNKLSGSIPTSIGNLSRLTRLYLRCNIMSGLIPREMLLLERLQECVLTGNGEWSCDFAWRFWGQ